MILPPGYDKDKVPAGFIAMPSDTYQGYALLRSVLKSGSEADVAQAVTYAKRIKVYPLAQADNPPPTVFVDAADVVFDSTIPYDLRFFESLDQMVQAEPWLERDKAMIDQLKTIGIERGKPFAPDAKTQQILNGAVKEAKAWFEARYDALPPFSIRRIAVKCFRAFGIAGIGCLSRVRASLRDRRLGLPSMGSEEWSGTIYSAS